MTDLATSLRAGETHIWFTDPLSLTPATEEILRTKILSSEEQSRYLRFRIPKVRTEFCAAHAMLRFALSKYSSILPYNVLPSGWQFTYDNYGKPSIASPRSSGIYFSLTHTSTMVACAISQVDKIGIDVEDAKRSIDYEAVAQRIFSKQELEEFAAIESPSKGGFFFTIWTLKEAFTKAIGLGLSMPVQRVSFHVEQGRILFSDPSELDVEPVWSFNIHDEGPHRLAIAQVGPHLNLKYFHLDLDEHLNNLLTSSGQINR